MVLVMSVLVMMLLHLNFELVHGVVLPSSFKSRVPGEILLVLISDVCARLEWENWKQSKNNEIYSKVTKFSCFTHCHHHHHQ